jgi:hypothetical protein
MNDEQNWIIVCNQDGERDKYLARDRESGYWTWNESLKYASTEFFATKTEAQASLDMILAETPNKMSDGTISAPSTLRRAAGLCNTKNSAVLFLCVHQLVIGEAISELRIPVQDKKPTGYTYD